MNNRTRDSVPLPTCRLTVYIHVCLVPVISVRQTDRCIRTGNIMYILHKPHVTITTTTFNMTPKYIEHTAVHLHNSTNWATPFWDRIYYSVYSNCFCLRLINVCVCFFLRVGAEPLRLRLTDSSKPAVGFMQETQRQISSVQPGTVPELSGDTLTSSSPACGCSPHSQGDNKTRESLPESLSSVKTTTSNYQMMPVVVWLHDTNKVALNWNRTTCGGWVQSPHKSFIQRNHLVKTYCTFICAGYMPQLGCIVLKLNYNGATPSLVVLYKQRLFWWSFGCNTIIYGCIYIGL